jgi:deoxyribodipyrimidine photolyase-related protein
MGFSPLILRLVLGGQLGGQINSYHRGFASAAPTDTWLLMEMRQQTDYVVHHIRKVVGFFSAMRKFSAWLRDKGHQVI